MRPALAALALQGGARRLASEPELIMASEGTDLPILLPRLESPTPDAHRASSSWLKGVFAIERVRYQMQTIAAPALYRLPGLAGSRIDPVGFVMAPIGIGIGGLAARARCLPDAVAGIVGAIDAEMLSILPQYCLSSPRLSLQRCVTPLR